MKPELIYALYKSKKLFPENLPDIAIELIKRGYENEYLSQIAGLTNPSREQLEDLVEKGFNQFLENNCDLMKLALIIAEGIIDDEIKPYDGASIIGEISEQLDSKDELWNFKCHIIQYDDLEDDKVVRNLGYDPKNIEIWQNEILVDIKNDAKKLIESFK